MAGANRRRRLALVCVLMLLFTASAFSAQDAVEKAKELEVLRTQIHSLQKKLEAGRKKKNKAEKKLHKVEQKISQASRVLRRIERDLENSHGQLAELGSRQRAQTEKLKQQRDSLAAEARAAYTMGRQQQVKLLLNQEQPAEVGRMLAYFGYFSRARAQQIESIGSTLSTLEELERSIARETRSLTELRAGQLAESQRLEEQKQARKQVLSQLSRQLKSQGGELKQLKTDEHQLQQLVYSLQELLVDIPADANQQQPFRTMKGKLRWPARGRLATRFGTQRGNSGLKWQGVVIAAPEGGEIRAVSQGRVAFADWMRGFGLLLIIDHGDGYMSLYGHNQVLYKEVGEWVDTGDVVATLGSSGGQTQSGVYFELRHKGRPVNPLRWCAGKPAAASG